MSNPSFWIQSSWRGDQSLEQICKRAKNEPRKKDINGIVSLYALFGSWNQIPKADHSGLLQIFDVLLHPHARRDTQYTTGRIQVDSEEEELESLCQENQNSEDISFPCPPENLPVLVMIVRRTSMKEPEIRYLSKLSPDNILKCWKLRKDTETFIPDSAKQEVKDFLHSFGLGASTVQAIPSPSTLSAPIPSISSPALRIFIGGDRMSVGKTSVCLGLIGTLVRMGYPTESIAYIKPATQNEKPQLIQHYCDRLGIECVSIGPIVYYRGFTRAFLDGETETSEELLEKVETAVDRLAEGKRVVIIDGVGFPAVGSICGTDNASVAQASGYPMENSDTKRRRPAGVVLVGGPGVGGAVDAFNLNSAYFERARVPVLGAIFNKLSLDGFYSLEKCKKAITSYFEQDEHQQSLGRHAFGFVPLFSGIAGDKQMEEVFEYIKVFQSHVDVDAILNEAAKVLDQSFPVEMDIDDGNHERPECRPTKRTRVAGKRNRPRSEIEQEAINFGAAPSA